MSLWHCIVCGEKLNQVGQSLKCTKGHSYDLSKYGSVHLLKSQKNKVRGDEKKMIQARSTFLNTGLYETFRNHLEELITSFACETVLDMGCGEGYYMEGLNKMLPNLYGFDVSKDAVTAASRRGLKNIALASSFSIPVIDDSFDAAYSIFAPFSEDEINRILKDSGIFIRVSPLENHLVELKEVIYDTVILNDTTSILEGPLKFLRRDSVKFKKTLDHDALVALFEMTPYVHKTHPNDKAKLDQLSKLEVSFEFAFDIYQKEPAYDRK